ncbi:DNA-nicking endonuclease, Smr domain [Roseomonas rosea]|uniref:DNA-nicking endonuclease, Smr domain n=1 Tax=Muricoccus roseus TaxID=198092 RepID=A0A1M6FLK2_9PROT|nr:Smr/MutS family protein [Roseomonas rosea]SHI98591.1 DNA-nicking endonuclease, Smr domain [Roseomonas rosea]
MARRPRIVSASERALWHAYLSLNAVEALPGREAPPPPSAPLPEPAPAPAGAPAPPRPKGPPTVPPVAVGQPGAGMDDKRWRDLRRGKTRPERTLDLHGRRAEEAHGATIAFLRGAHADGVRCVAIVTGKGSGEGGILRRELPHWLNLPSVRPLILGAAHPHRANTGAVHLLLRRRR